MSPNRRVAAPRRLGVAVLPGSRSSSSQPGAILQATTILLLLLSTELTSGHRHVNELTSSGHHRNHQFYGGMNGNHHVGHDSTMGDENDSSLPVITEPVQNNTVSIGKDAILACVVHNLGNYQVAWIRVDTQTILSIHHKVITQNPRITLSYTDHRTWSLHIKEAQEADRGWYMCQVNTDPMRSKQGYLEVVMPPSFVTKETSSDMVVRESSNVTLTCKATGYPEPYVMWAREGGLHFQYNGEMVTFVNGEYLHISKISRLHMGAYLCIAANGVLPKISHKVEIKVQFPPMLSIPNQLEGAYIGQNVTLECHTEAYPDSINYWTTEHGDMIVSGNYRSILGNKYEANSTKSGYSQYMKLIIKNVGPKDFGSYKCVAQNSLGGTDGVIKLEEIPAPSTTTQQPPLRKNGKNGNRPNDYEVEEWRDSDYKREYGGMPSSRPGADDTPSSGALSLAPTSGPEAALSLILVMLTHLLVLAVRR